LQRKAAGSALSASVPPLVHDVLRSPGQPLDPYAREYMEPRFGHDFGRVQVHTDARAADSARAVHALAYTVGRDIVFAAGQYSPRTEAGRRLITHELHHVVQQGGEARGLQTQKDPSAPPAQETPSEPPDSEIIWNFQVDRSMCGLEPRIRQFIRDRALERETLAICGQRGYTTAGEVMFDCFFKLLPQAYPVAVTTPGGAFEREPKPTDPFGRIIYHSGSIHEMTHRSRLDRVARSLGADFWAAWQRIGPRQGSERLDMLRSDFPGEVAEIEAVFNQAEDLIQDETRARIRQEDFLSDVLDVLNRICR
jgi:hypothetical protein